MKKILMFAATAAVALSSCSKNEVSEISVANENPNAIGLNIGAFATKSAATAAGTLETAGVTLYSADATFGDLTFTFATPDWSNAEGQTWNNVGFPMSVYSIFPTDVVTPGATGTFSYSVDNAVAAQKDLVYFGQTLAAIPNDGKISAIYKHALSRVKMANTTETAKWTSDIKKVYLKNVSNSANAAITPATNSIEWTTFSGASASEFDLASYAAADDDMYIIPQTTETATTLAADQDYVEALCVVYAATTAKTPKTGYIDLAALKAVTGNDKITLSNDGGTTYTYTGALYVKVGFPIPSQSFVAGTYYNLKLDFTGGNVFVAEDGFFTADGVKIIVKENGGGEVTEPGKDEEVNPDATTTKIGLTVSVDTWPGTATPDVEL